MHEDGGIVSEVPFDEESSGAVLKVVEEDLEMNNKMEEARLKSLNRLEQSGVDLPVRAIETVLDREITPEDYYGARYLGSLPCGSNANVADDDPNVQPLEMHPADQSRFELANKSSFVFPKVKSRRIKVGLALCCIVHLGFVALIVAVATNRNDKESYQFAKSVESGNDESDESPTTTIPTTTCEDEVSINGRCFVAGSDVVVRFQNCLPLSDDWLGVYDSQANIRDLGDDLVSWMWTCGDQECEGEVSSSVLEFTDVLEPGNYNVYLIRRNSGGPYSAYASSAEFQVTESARDCET
jgi:hypothetical protein